MVAHRFVGAFLMPAEALRPEAGKRRTLIGWQEIIELQRLPPPRPGPAGPVGRQPEGARISRTRAMSNKKSTHRPTPRRADGLHTSRSGPAQDAPMQSQSQAPRRASDGFYKAAYSHPRMVADTLRYLARRGGRFDAATLDTLAPRHPRAGARRVDHGELPPPPRRQGLACAYRRSIAYRGADADRRPASAHDWLFVLLEFQSTPDPNMSWRLVEYAVELHRALADAGAVAGSDPPPAMLPVVVYNGRAPWSPPAGAAWSRWAPAVVQRMLARQGVGAFDLLALAARGSDAPWPGNALRAQIEVESALASEGLGRLPAAVAGIGGIDDGALRRTLLDWLRGMNEGWQDPALRKLLEEMEEMSSLDEFDARFAERLIADAKRMQNWEVERGRAQGMEQGIAQGIAQERALLRRMAAHRFGAEAGDRLAAIIEGVGDAARLAEIGVGIMDCGSVDELLELATRAPR